MPIITVNVKAFWDWKPRTALENILEPSNADIDAKKFKRAADGGWLKKVEIEAATHTQVVIPESEITNYSEHFARKNTPKTRERVVAQYLEEHVMGEHAHPNHWLSIEVHDEPNLEKYLNTVFNLKGKAASAPAVAASADKKGA